MRRGIGVLAGVVLLIGSSAIAVGAATVTSPRVLTPTESTYTAHTTGTKGLQDWRAWLDVSLTTGCYTFSIDSPVAPTCWYAKGTHATAWPAGYRATGGILHVLAAGSVIEFKCANGHAAGPMWVTVVATTMSGTP